MAKPSYQRIYVSCARKGWAELAQRFRKDLKGHSDFFHSVELTQDLRRSAAASEDRTLKVWDLERGRKLRSLKGHSYSVYAVAVSPDGRLVVSVPAHRRTSPDLRQTAPAQAAAAVSTYRGELIA